MIDSLFKNIPEAETFLPRLRSILGTGSVQNGQLHVKLNFSWNTPQEASEVKAKVARMRRELSLLRSEVVRVVQKINADFSSLVNSLTREQAHLKPFIRQKQLEVRDNYERLKDTIDRLDIELETVSRADPN
jgi:hypothetical protein